ncbi:MAG: C39 family peptidase [Candidatus Coprovivens sp.]
MKKNTKNRLISSILAGIIFLSGLSSKPMKAYAKEIDYPSTSLDDTSFNNKPTFFYNHKLTKEEFLNNIEDKQKRKYYTQLYELYDFDKFNSRSEIPQFFQTIYSNRFSCGTIQSAGCGISSLAMVASYLFDEIITPDMMTIFDSGPSPASAFEKAIKKLKLNCEIYRGQEATDNLDKALDSGHPIIALMGRNSIFTERGHFIVIAGKNSEGKYIVNDPNLQNCYNPQMVDRYTNGFTKEEITLGLNGIYIFDTKKDFIDKRDKTISIKNASKKESIQYDSNRYIGYTTQSEPLKSGTSENHKTITNLEINSQITRILSTGNGWDLVKSNNYIGYIKTNNLSYTKEIDKEESSITYYKQNDIVITNQQADLKISPTNSSETIINIDEKSELEVLATTDYNWLLVRYNGLIGYIAKENTISLLEKAQQLYPELNLNNLKAMKTIYIISNTEFRSGNGVEFPSLYQLERYETTRVLAEYNDWYFVLTNENNFGFIAKSDTKEIKEKEIIIDKSSNKLYYYIDGERAYTIPANNIKKIISPQNGFYSILGKKRDLVLFDQQIGWHSIFDNSNSKLNSFARIIYNDIQTDERVLIHK